MIDRISPRKAGLTLAGVMVGWHLCWLLLVAAGLAQRLIDFILWMHFIKPVYVVEPFEMTRALILLAVTAAIGFAFGSAFAYLWNIGHKT